MQGLPTAISLSEYLGEAHQPDCDLVDGAIEERNLGEYPHSKLQLELGFWFRLHAAEWQINPLVEQRIQISAARVRVCDVCLLRADAPRENVIVTAPLLCVEILSPEDRLSRAVTVLEDYRTLGVPQSWLLDPVRRSAYVFSGAGLHQVAGDRLELPGTAVHVELSTLFAALD